MKKIYLVSRLFYRIIEAESPAEAWSEYATNDSEKDIVCSREEIRLKLTELGYKKMSKTNLDGVFQIFT